MMKSTLTGVVLSTLLLSACQSAGPLLPQAGGLRPNSGLTSQSAAQGNLNRTALKASQHLQAQAVPGELIVRFRPGVAAAATQTTLRSLNLSTVQSIGNPALGIQLVRTAPANQAQALQALRSNPTVAYAEPNGIMSIPQVLPGRATNAPRTPVAYPNDAMFKDQYAHKMTESVKGWEIQKGRPDLVLAVVDTGIDLKHPDLAAKLTKGYDMVDKDEDPMDGQGHGTHCASIAASLTHNEIGVAGYAPNVKVMPVRVLDNRGSGTWADVADGIMWAADNGAQVISLSLGGGSDAKVVADAVAHAIAKDSVVVAATGNGGNNRKSYPAAYPGVVAVGATDSQDQRARFSQYGEWVSVTAPGVDILAAFPTYASGMPGKDYGAISGTSMATPAVAGLAALVRSQYPQLKQADVKKHIELTSDDRGDKGFDIYYGHGRINLPRALSTAPGRF
jgi:thermitase